MQKPLFGYKQVDKMSIFTIKKSRKKGFWQAKSGEHEIIHLSYFEPVLKPLIHSLGWDPEDSGPVYRMNMSTEAFEGFQLKLELAPCPEQLCDINYQGQYYTVAECILPGLHGEGGILHSKVLDAFWTEPPGTLWVSFEKAE